MGAILFLLPMVIWFQIYEWVAYKDRPALDKQTKIQEAHINLLTICHVLCKELSTQSLDWYL
jgi:hypothetical protein